MDLEGVNVIVTSGGTREYIDDVRVMTNISSGALGCKIAESLYQQGAHVWFIYGKSTLTPDPAIGINSEARLSLFPVNSADDTLMLIKALTSSIKMSVVVHSMAVSDFTFERKNAIKCKSNNPEDFIEYMRQSIRLNPKIIKHIKEWSPKSFVVGFKFEVGKTQEELFKAALPLIENGYADIVIANDKVQMQNAKQHIAYLLTKETTTINTKYEMFIGKEKISQGLINYLKSV